MDIIKFKGVIPSPPDNHDFEVAGLVPSMASSFAKDFRIDPVGSMLNQLDEDCVANALAKAREIIEFKQSKIEQPFSPGFIYGNRLPSDYQGQGMIPREALSHLLKEGACLLKDFKYELEYPAIKSKLDYQKILLLSKAVPYKISAYAAIKTDNDYKNALQSLGPAIFIVALYESFENVGPNGVVPLPKKGEKLLGGHCMLAMGWENTNYKVIENSWGSSWGDHGFCYFPPTYPVNEMWSITDSILPTKK